MEWKQYAFAGAPPLLRWGHSATLHDTRVVLYGGRDDMGYHSSYDIIDVAVNLIDIPPEELERDKHRKQQEERIKQQQIMGDLQRDVEDLKLVINQIGEALVKQTRQADETPVMIRALAEANLELKSKLDALSASGGGDGGGNTGGGATNEEVAKIKQEQVEMKALIETLAKAQAALLTKLEAVAAPPSTAGDDAKH